MTHNQKISKELSNFLIKNSNKFFEYRRKSTSKACVNREIRSNTGRSFRANVAVRTNSTAYAVLPHGYRFLTNYRQFGQYSTIKDSREPHKKYFWGDDKRRLSVEESLISKMVRGKIPAHH
jgi:hypothetical protein